MERALFFRKSRETLSVVKHIDSLWDREKQQ